MLIQEHKYVFSYEQLKNKPLMDELFAKILEEIGDPDNVIEYQQYSSFDKKIWYLNFAVAVPDSSCQVYHNNEIIKEGYNIDDTIYWNHTCPLPD